MLGSREPAGIFSRRRVRLSPAPLRRQTDSAARWTLSFVRPYRRAVALLAGLSLIEIVLRAVAPWPLKLIVDYLAHALVPPSATIATLTRSWPPTLFIAAVV